jgi:hypothetical protein
MRLNRGVLLGLLSLFGKIINNYVNLHDPTRRFNPAKRAWLIKRAEHRLQANSLLYAAYLQYKWYTDKAFKFKGLITEKYMRLALMNAKRTYVECAHEVPLDDIIQVYLIYLSKAIDRCDSRQGVLTTFIQNWFYNARHDVLRVQKEEHNISYDDLKEDLNSVLPECPYEDLQHLAWMAKQVDPEGIIRHEMNIPEFFTYEQRMIINKVFNRKVTTDGLR